MTLTRTGAPSHTALSGVTAAQHHTATVAADLALADLATRAHTDLSDAPADAHHAQAHNLDSHATRTHANLQSVGAGDHHTAPIAATQAEMEAESAVEAFLVPDLAHFGPWAAKCWCSIDAAGLLQAGDYQIATIGDTGTGDRDVNFTTAFSSALYVVLGQVMDGAGTNDDFIVTIESRTTADVRFFLLNLSPLGAVDAVAGLCIFGDQ